MIKFKKIAVFLALTFMFVTPMIVEAQYEKPTNTYGVYEPDGANPVVSLGDKIVKWILSGITILSLVFVIVGAVMYVISGEDTSKAKNMIFNAVIGLIIALLGYTIVLVVGEFLKK